MNNSEQPAFAVSKEMCESSNITEYPFGLTKREYFSGFALQAILSNNTFMNELYKESKKQGKTTDLSELVAQVSVVSAEELLKQLEKSKL